jgi:hypothetical protein
MREVATESRWKTAKDIRLTCEAFAPIDRLSEAKVVQRDEAKSEVASEGALQRISDVRVRVLGKCVKGAGYGYGMNGAIDGDRDNDYATNISGVSVDSVIHSLFNGSCDFGYFRQTTAETNRC